MKKIILLFVVTLVTLVSIRTFNDTNEYRNEGTFFAPHFRINRSR